MYLAHRPGRKPVFAPVLIVLASAALALSAPAPAGAAPPPGVEVVSQGPDGFELRISVPEPTRTPVTLDDGRTYLEVELPGFFSILEPGRPDLPLLGLPFAFPEGAAVRLEVEALRVEEFRGAPPVPGPSPRVDPGDGFAVPVVDMKTDPAAYASTASVPGTWAELGPEAGWRTSRIRTVNLTPVQAVAATGAYRVARELAVRVRFDRSAAPALPDRVPAGRDYPVAEAAFNSLLINAESARSFRQRLRPPAGITGAAQAGNGVRIRVGGSGLARIPFQELRDAGLPESLPVEQVRLEDRNHTANERFTVAAVPRIVEDANGNGTFDAGDHLVFYAFDFEDRFQPRFFDSRFTYFNAYWVVGAAEGGAEFTVRDGAPTGSATPVANFPSLVHLEEERYYINFPPDLTGLFVPVETTVYWLGPFNRDADLSVDFTAPDPDPAGTTTLRAAWQGAFLTGPSSTHRVSLDLNGTRVLDSRAFFGTQTLKWTGDPQPTSGLLNAGSNRVDVVGRGSTDTVIGSGAYFDFVDVIYDRLLVADDDALLFNSGESEGDLEYTVTGFTDPDVLLLDLTDPAAPVRITGEVTDAGDGTWTLRFQDTAGRDRRTYAALVASRVSGLPAAPPLPEDLVDEGLIGPGSDRDLLAEGDGSDIIIITHPRFLDAFRPLAQHREDQGHRVLLCSTQEVYDQFAGGRKTAWAIQRLVNEAFRTWSRPPVHLLLGADASEDYRGDVASSDPDWVPTMMHLASVPGALQLRELAGTDTWFVSGAAPGDSWLDVVPDLWVGRLPVGSVEQARDVVEKIIGYESSDPGDDWRNRGVFLADDAYSTSITATSFYCFRPIEEDFQETVDEICDDLIPNAGGLPDFDCVPWQLYEFLDTLDVAGRNPGAVNDCPTKDTGQTLLLETQDYARDVLNPRLIDDLSRGSLIWGFTGHANKNQMTTESLFIYRPQFSPASRDVDKINNFGKPFIFHGFACHLAEFEHATEGDVGESIGEALLLARNRGAIASVASSGYEWAHLNRSAQLAITEPLFWSVPRDPDTGRPVRVLGPTSYSGLLNLAAQSGFNPSVAALLRTYVLLGDPATRIDIAVPSFDVTVSGAPVGEGFKLVADSLDDSLTVEAIISEDTDLRTLRVFDGEQELPTERVTVENLNPESTGAQRFRVSFNTVVRLGSYDLVIEASDWFGRQSRFVLPVRYETRFSSNPTCFAPGSEETSRELDPDGGNRIDASEAVLGAVESPVPLEAEDFTVLVDGNPFPEAVAVPTDETGRAWTVEVNRLWEDGDHALVISASRGGQTVERSVTFTVSEADLELAGEPFFYPNPTPDVDGALHYELTRGAVRGEIVVYSVSGRRVLREVVNCNAGRNSYRWDLRDEAGDPVANGVYLMLLRVKGFDGEDLSHMERVAVTR